ncbi:major facilitator superfamily domain-containing protein [Aspergillus recurvatus]
MNDTQKIQAAHLEHVDTGHAPVEEEQASMKVVTERGQENKGLLRKIDCRMLPLLVFSYMLQYMDKVSLSNAMILGVEEDLSLRGTQFSWLSSIFYFGYLAASYPVSIILVRFPLGKTLAIAITAWGAILALHSAAVSFSRMMVLRALLGVFESPISPGFTLITSIWYKPSQHAARHGIWFAGNSMGAIAGALVAYGCAYIDRALIARWQVLFIILGCLTFLWGLFLIFSLPDSPLRAPFLSQAERVEVHEEIQSRQKTAKTDTWSWPQFSEAMRDPQSWFLFAIEGTGTLVNGVVSNFTSLILSSFGYSTEDTLLLNIPIYFFMGVVVLSSVWLANRTRRSRILIAMAGNIIAVAGGVLLVKLPSSNKGGRYAGLLLICASNNGFPLYMSLISSNIGGFTKRATVNAIFFIGYCAGNIAGPQFYIKDEAPVYTTAFTSMLVIFCADAVLLLLFRLYLQRENAKRDREQGVYIDPESRDGDATLVREAAEASASVDAPVYQTDWENRSFRYYL